MINLLEGRIGYRGEGESGVGRIFAKAGGIGDVVRPKEFPCCPSSIKKLDDGALARFDIYRRVLLPHLFPKRATILISR